MILLTHYIDLDGIGSVILSKYAGIEYDKIVGASYEPDDHEILKPHGDKTQTLISTDYRITKELYEFFNNDFEDFLSFDHHEETLQFKDDERVFIDITKSGTLLFYENVIDDSVKNMSSDYLVSLINTYDMWNKESELWPEALNLNRVLWSTLDWKYPEKDFNRHNGFVKLQVEKLQKDFFRWTDYELNLISYQKMKEREAIEQAESNLQIREDNRGNKFGLYWGWHKISIVCNALLEKNPELTYIIAINTYQSYGKDEAVNGKISVRSVGDFNVGNLAGVRGHKNAGGGNLTVEFLTNLWNNRILQIPYKRGIKE